MHPRVKAPLFYPCWQQHIPSYHVTVTQARHQGAEPTIKHNAPSWSCKQTTWPKQNTATENMQEFTQEQNIKDKNQIYYSSESEHSLIIHQIPTTQHSNSKNYKGASIMGGSSRGLESGSTKRGEIHHIATGHGPMVQGGLLTAHPGGIHGYGWSLGGGSSFRHGSGATSQAAPILKRRWR